jgi:lysophospholipase L1-like esterase
MLCATCALANAANSSEWIATWAASDMAAGNSQSAQKIAALEMVTLRQVVRTTIGGDSVRLRISNAFGDKPLILAGASVALRAEAATVVAATSKTVTFGGAAGVSIPAGEFLYSDSVPLQTEAFSELAVSLYFPQALPTPTRHGDAAEATYISSPGTFVASATFPVAQETRHALFVTGIDVATGSAKLIVCLGDSITEGAGAERHTDWPAVLASRLAGEAGVINQGITGSRLLHDFTGESALKRFERDVLSWPNVDYVIVAIGINDLRYPMIDAAVLPAGVDRSAVSADDMIAGYRKLIAMAHGKGVGIIGATLTPFEGESMFYSAQGEATRIAINQWIRASGEFDAVIDFDRVVRDQAQPTRLGAQFHDDDDWLHPNEDGYRAMADSIDLSIFDERTPR